MIGGTSTIRIKGEVKAPKTNATPMKPIFAITLEGTKFVPLPSKLAKDDNELSKIKEEVLSNEVDEEDDNESDVLSYFSKAQKSIVRDRIIAGEKNSEILSRLNSSPEVNG